MATVLLYHDIAKESITRDIMKETNMIVRCPKVECSYRIKCHHSKDHEDLGWPCHPATTAFNTSCVSCQPIKCTCGNPEMGFNCVCEHVKSHPGNRNFSCEYCGIYTASAPKCNRCEDDGN